MNDNHASVPEDHNDKTQTVQIVPSAIVFTVHEYNFFVDRLIEKAGEMPVDELINDIMVANTQHGVSPSTEQKAQYKELFSHAENKDNEYFPFIITGGKAFIKNLFTNENVTKALACCHLPGEKDLITRRVISVLTSCPFLRQELMVIWHASVSGSPRLRFALHPDAVGIFLDVLLGHYNRKGEPVGSLLIVPVEKLAGYSAKSGEVIKESLCKLTNAYTDTAHRLSVNSPHIASSMLEGFEVTGIVGDVLRNNNFGKDAVEPKPALLSIPVLNERLKKDKQHTVREEAKKKTAAIEERNAVMDQVVYEACKVRLAEVHSFLAKHFPTKSWQEKVQALEKIHALLGLPFPHVTISAVTSFVKYGDPASINATALQGFNYITHMQLGVFAAAEIGLEALFEAEPKSLRSRGLD